MNRLTKDEYYLKIASVVAERSTCLRSMYGAVIVKNDEIVATGYNGSPRGEVNCCDVDACWRVTNNIPSGERYEMCRAVHAEQNAIISASRDKLTDATLYLFRWIGEDPSYDPKPCDICRRLIINSGIKDVVVFSNTSEGIVPARVNLNY